MVVPKFRAVFKNKIISEVGSIDFINKTVTIPIYDKETDEYLADYELSLDLVTLMQSTGLFDINGKEIFEGDIVRMHSGELLPVKLHHGMFEPVCYYISNVFERVGNVFENPELLEHPDFREVLND
ncbi:MULTISPECIES: YopX family protein [Streptococcus]|uniref:YopX family protein n=1 Tax=Streptococcus TaxID=1301 RepID=UPI000C188D11|nr:MULTISPECIES: YopX family protein [Streptococcus]